MSQKELESFSRAELVTFLRDRGKPVSGLKAELLQRARLFKDDPILSKATNAELSETFSNLTKKRSVFTEESITWQDVSSLDPGKIASDFNIDIINIYLTELFL